MEASEAGQKEQKKSGEQKQRRTLEAELASPAHPATNWVSCWARVGVTKTVFS